MQSCGECTLCCKLCKIKDISPVQGEYCEHCIPDNSCLIYDTRPDQCRKFNCVWLQMEKVHIDLRPDNCGVVFEKLSEGLIIGVVDDKLDTVSELINNQISFFLNEGISVFLQQLNPYKFVCKMSEGIKKQDIINILEKKANDCS